MPSYEKLASQLQRTWSAIQARERPIPSCFIGFDGFTDEIVKAVEQRSNKDKFTPFSTIQRFGERITAAAGKSCNIELVAEATKLGGNAPIMTDALLNGGHSITFCGPIGLPGAIEPVFQKMTERCARVIPLGPSAHSDAIEFEDGKIILGKMEALKHVTYDTILEQIPKQELIQLLDACDLFVCANWTMLPAMNELWGSLLEEIIPQLKPKKRYLFADLADPAKRSDSDLKKAIALLQKFNRTFEVHLGLNEAEALRIAQVLTGERSSAKTPALAQSISKLTQLQIVVHATAQAATADHAVDGPYTPTPKMTTGAGDNFNAGYCNALLYGFSPEDCLLSGVATSGYYVRNGQSPTIPQLAEFLRLWAAQKLE